jgi:TetR/AcrR family transcriptional regulator, regulator of cefoperazone and chloramphenicol sensitivity
MKDCSQTGDTTKARLIEAGGEVFARHGFHSATIREICKQAKANVCAVNYHFRDKKGLYAEVLTHSYQSSVRRFPPDYGLPENSPPEEKLRGFIRAFLLRILDKDAPSWHGTLIMREISEPSEALKDIVENSMRPVYSYLADVCREMLGEEKTADGKDSDRTFMCAMSIIGQCAHHFTAKHIINALRPKTFDLSDIDRIAAHITRFSIAGIKAHASGT